MEFYMFGAGMLFLGVLLGVVGIAVYKSQVTYSLFILYSLYPVNQKSEPEHQAHFVFNL